MKFHEHKAALYRLEGLLRQMKELKQIQPTDGWVGTCWERRAITVPLPDGYCYGIVAERISVLRAEAQELAAQIGVEYEEPENG